LRFAFQAVSQRKKFRAMIAILRAGTAKKAQKALIGTPGSEFAIDCEIGGEY